MRNAQNSRCVVVVVVVDVDNVDDSDALFFPEAKTNSRSLHPVLLRAVHELLQTEARSRKNTTIKETKLSLSAERKEQKRLKNEKIGLSSSPSKKKNSRFLFTIFDRVSCDKKGALFFPVHIVNFHRYFLSN